MHYTAYLLSIDSEIALPELSTDPAGGAESPDVSIRLGDVSPDGLPEGLPFGRWLWVDRDRLWLHVPNVARFLVQGGNSIRIDPEPGVDDDSLRLFLLGSALGALLMQRGYLVLHGNAIRVGDQCLVCVGHSGAGKSTLAAGFMQRGYAVLADDVVPVNEGCCALPGFPRIKLWQDVADQLGIDTSTLRRIQPDIDKFNYPLSRQFWGAPVPIRWVYLLSSDDSDRIQCEAMRGMRRFQTLLGNTYRGYP